MIAKNDSLGELFRDARPLRLYELAALGYAVLREPELLGGYAEALQRASRGPPPASRDPGPPARRAGAVRNGAPGVSADQRDPGPTGVRHARTA